MQPPTDRKGATVQQPLLVGALGVCDAPAPGPPPAGSLPRTICSQSAAPPLLPRAHCSQCPTLRPPGCTHGVEAYLPLTRQRSIPHGRRSIGQGPLPHPSASPRPTCQVPGLPPTASCPRTHHIPVAVPPLLLLQPGIGLTAAHAPPLRPPGWTIRSSGSLTVAVNVYRPKRATAVPFLPPSPPPPGWTRSRRTACRCAAPGRASPRGGRSCPSPWSRWCTCRARC